ncbi:MAG: hypothetical protein ACHP9Y_06545 [Gammaproteobacteria bacterium]
MSDTSEGKADKLREFQNSLEPYAQKIIDKITLNNDEVIITKKVVADYYQYLDLSGVKYGQVAKDAALNSGSYGHLANIHLAQQASNEGKSIDDILAIQNNLRVMLANADVTLRIKDGLQEVSYRAIADYHYSALKKQGLSKYVWGGTFLEEFVGSGSWMDVGGYDTSIDVLQLRALTALARNDPTIRFSGCVKQHEF